MAKKMKKLLNKWFIGTLFVVLIVMIGGVFALDKVITPPNLKDYKIGQPVPYPTITLRDCGFLGMGCWLGGTGTQKATLELTKNTEVCSNNCEAQTSITLNEDGALIDDVRFYRIINDEKVLGNVRIYNFYVQTGTQETEVPDYELQCSITGYELNGSAIQKCSSVKIGTHTEETPIWTPYNIGEIKPAGDYVVKLTGNKRADWTYDWQIETKGTWIDDWAVWGNATILPGLEVYYSLDETTGTNALDSFTGLHNGTSVTPIFTSGILGNARNFSNTLPHNLQVFTKDTTGATFNSSNWSVSFWAKQHALRIGTLIGNTVAPSYSDCFLIGTHTANGGNISYNTCGGTALFATIQQPMDKWYHVVMTIKDNTNITFYINGTYAGSSLASIPRNTLNNISIGGDDSYGGWVGGIDEVGMWNRTLTQTDVSNLYNNGVGVTYASILAGGTGSYMTINSPADNALSISPVIFNCSAHVSGVTLTNMSLWTNITGTWSLTQNTSVTGTDNITTFTQPFAIGSYLWNCQGCDSDGDCGFAPVNRTIRVSLITENSQTYSPTTTELASETFSINVTYDSITYPFAVANLVYNGTSYLGTNIGSGIFTRTLTIPSVTANSNMSFYWNFVLGANSIDSTVYNQSVRNFGLDDCSAYSKLLYNFTIRDEGTRALVYPNGTLKIDLYLSTPGTENKAISYTRNFNETDSKTICANLNFTAYRVDMVGEYQSYGYVQKFYYIDNGTLLNSSTPYNIDLHDLLLADSTTFLFHFTDSNGQIVQNAVVLVYRDYIGEGIFREVERAKTDNNGETHVHLVEEDVIYYFVITKDSKVLFTSATYNAKCLSTPCELSLTASPTDINWSIIDNEGGKYSVTTNKATRVATLTFYLEKVDLVNFTIRRFYNGAYDTVNQSSLTAQVGSISLHVPITYGNVTFYGLIYRNNTFVKWEFIDLTESGINYFGTFGAILGALVLITIMLMAVSEGAGFIIFTSLALALMMFMQIVDLGWLAVISLICAGGVILYKLISRRGRQG